MKMIIALLLFGCVASCQAVMVYNCAWNWSGDQNTWVSSPVSVVCYSGELRKVDGGGSVTTSGAAFTVQLNSGQSIECSGVQQCNSGGEPVGPVIQDDSLQGEAFVYVDANLDLCVTYPFPWLVWFWNGFWLGGSFSALLCCVSAVRAGLGVGIDYRSSSSS